MNNEEFGKLLGDVDIRREELLIMQSGAHVTREDLRLMHEQLCEQARCLMKAKNQDYAVSSDPFRNFRTFEELGILVRLSDKIARLRTFCETGTIVVKNESVRDTIYDIINYAVLFHGYLVDCGKLLDESSAHPATPPLGTDSGNSIDGKCCK